MKTSVFLSYSHRDSAWVRRFVRALRGHGYDIWFDLEQLSPGSDISREIRNALRKSSHVVVIPDPKSLISPNTFFELGVAIGMKRPVTLVIPRSAKGLPADLTGLRHVYRTTPSSTAKSVARALDSSTDREESIVAA